MHRIVGFLGDTEHHLQAVFDLSLAFFAACEELLLTDTQTNRNHDNKHLLEAATEAERAGLVACLQQELVLGDSLHGLDQIGGDGVGQSVPLLNFLQRGEQSCTLNLTFHTRTIELLRRR